MSSTDYNTLPIARSVLRSVETVGAFRVAGGILASLAPAMLPTALGADTGTAARAAWLVRMFAARDAALGAGTIWAVRRGADPRPWMLAQAVGDAADAAALLAATRQGHLATWRGRSLAAFAAIGAVCDIASVVALSGRRRRR